MEVKIHNDGKSKDRSFECYLDLDNLNISGCGYDKEEAFISMIESLKSTINYLNKLSEELQSGEVKFISVDCFGKKLNRTPPSPPPGREIREWEVPK